ncbi:helix-turn-helix domain-containing protein [Mycolicibacterium fortuitum]|uniref:helix-turn-helix domain-containing protein n=1 Tax=Mycolicibacterium fortuitum TaxID=1766 RepID=UPI00148FB599|nr:helix-turn-helix domain-containing protein [Mycolicibacterium fortuitum]
MPEPVAKLQHLPALVSLRAAANYLDVSERTCRRYVATGRLSAVRVGPRMIRIHRSSIEAMLGVVGGAA